MRRSFILPIVIFASLAVALAAAGVQATRSIVLSEGHADAFQPKLEDGELVLYFRDDTASKLGSVDPSDVLMVVNPAAELSIPGSSQYAFLGNPSDSIWILPQTAQAGILWPGLSTESLDGEWEGNQVELSLVSFSGPGAFYLYEIGSLLEVNILWRSDNLGASSFSVPVDLHAHMNWAFTQPGLYTLGVRACGTHTGPGESLGAICSDVEAYAVEVVANETAASPATAATVSPAATATGSPTPTATPLAATPTPDSGTQASAGPNPDGEVAPSSDVAGVTPPATGDSGIAESDGAKMELLLLPLAIVALLAVMTLLRRRPRRDIS